MKKQMIWGLATLILLLGIAAVFLLMDNDTNTEPRLVLGQATKKLLEEGPQRQSTPLPDGHGHDGEWHNKGHQSEPESPKALSKKEIAARYTKEERDYWQSQGLNPPSPGYFYRHDENGVPKLYAENQPHFRLTGWTEGYGNTTLLSDEEWERYKALIPIANQTRLVLKEGMGTRDTTMFPDDVAALAREWMNELWEKTKSPLPIFSSFAQYTRPQTPEDQEGETQLLREQHDTHVPPDTRSSHANHILIKSILNELKAELRRR